MIRKTAIAAVAVCGLAITACGGDTVYVVAEPTTTLPAKTTTTTVKPTDTRPPSQPQAVSDVYDPEAYDAFLWEQVNDFWWLYSKDQLLQMGLLICEEFDSGATLDQVNSELMAIMENTDTLYLMNGVAAMSAAAVTFLCPEHSWWLETL